jgi:hypothetical protein
MNFISKNRIELSKTVTSLDRFAIDFTKVLKKYTNYVIISGYVSILLGRQRTTEQVHIIVPKMQLTHFRALLLELRENEFYCLDAEYDEGIYEQLLEGKTVRFAAEDTVAPFVDLKFAKTELESAAMDKPITVRIGKDELTISHLEMQIAFKEKLGSEKDLEDAEHIRNIAKGNLDAALIKKYKKMI